MISYSRCKAVWAEIFRGHANAAARISQTNARAKNISAHGFKKADCRFVFRDVWLESIAKSGAEAARFWEIRDGSDSIERLYPAVYSFDVSLSPSDFTNYIEEVKAGLASCGETCSLYSFGHMADGNIHFMVGCANADPSLHGLISNLVYDPLSRYFSSSISAEHCIGIEKAAHVSRSRPAQQLALMRLLKRSLDPKGLLNPHIAFWAMNTLFAASKAAS